MVDLKQISPRQKYLDYLKNGELAYQVCTDDGAVVFYPRAVAPITGSENLEWRVSDGVGTIYSTTTVMPRGKTPYDVSLVDMDEGFRLMSRVEGIDPMDVKIGMRVKFKVHQDDEDSDPYPVFEVAGE
ncbi:MAG: OB-fold domain-containing protein [Proteobacteria bacterium]|nr:OB-fold domain-containing protein [Pseudomonadota bacterium]